MAYQLDGICVAIIATDGFEESELLEPKKALEDSGASVSIVAPHPGEIVGMKHDVKNAAVPVDVTLDSANPDAFDAVMLPGGALNADALRVNAKAQEFVKAMDEEGKPIAFICHAPWLLVSANLVSGRRLTSYFTIHDDIKNAGGDWEDSEVVQDGNWVSSRQPSDIPTFNNAMISLFKEYKSQES